MTTQLLAISGTSIRQDSEDRYCLNDFHKAAGEESKHQPAFFIRRDETKELIVELCSANMQTIKPVEIIKGRGKQQGTYVCKELVYAYAMWISPKFHIAVIRAYDAMVAAKAVLTLPEKPSKKQIAGGLTLEQQDAIKALVKSRVEVLPKDKQAKAAITCWSSLKSKFGKTYKAIAPEEFTNALSLVARLDLEEKVKHVQGELVESEALADENKYTVKHFKEVMEHFGYGFIDNRQHVAVNRSDFEQVKAALSVSGRMLSLLEKH